MTKRQLIGICAAAAVCVAAAAIVVTARHSESGTYDAVYLGVQDYGTVTAEDKDSFRHLFEIDGKEHAYTVSTENRYAIQNTLQEGYAYNIKVQDGQVVEATFADDNARSTFTPPVSGTPGELTLRNYLATILEPVGTTLYVYGGGWDWQDEHSANQAMTIGVPQSWVDFFDQQDADYNYKDPDPAYSYYPFGSWNQYYYAGLDCSGYIGWALYNVMSTESRTNDAADGDVLPARKMAKSLADNSWGTLTTEIHADDFRPGDICSMDGHIWTVIGVCDDGSIVIAHSSPTDSKNGYAGGGVQLSALNPVDDDNQDCEAYALAQEYMSRYYPEWSSRYDAVLKSYEQYTTFESDTAGLFHWDLVNALSDPDGYADRNATEILAALYS